MDDDTRGGVDRGAGGEVAPDVPPESLGIDDLTAAHDLWIPHAFVLQPPAHEEVGLVADHGRGVAGGEERGEGLLPAVRLPIEDVHVIGNLEIVLPPDGNQIPEELSNPEEHYGERGEGGPRVLYRVVLENYVVCDDVFR